SKPQRRLDNGSCRWLIAGKLLCFLVALLLVRDLLLCAKHLFAAAIGAIVGCRELKDEQWEFFSPEILNRAWPQSRWREGAFPAWLSRASKALACRWRPSLGVWG